MDRNAILVHPGDNVAVATREIKSGEAVAGVNGAGITARADIPKNHKVAIEEISEGSAVIKYGEPIGRAGEAIHAGDWVHTHNLKAEEG